jgi:transposase
MMGKDGLDKAREIRHAYRMAFQPFDPGQEISLVTFTLRLTPLLRQQLYHRLHQAYASGSLRLVKRLHALLAIAEGMAVRDVAQMLDLGEQTVRDYLNRFLWQGGRSCIYKQPPGRPAKLTKTQRQALAELIQAGPQAAGYTSGGWNTPMIQDLIYRHFGVEYHPHYICTLLHNLGFSYQKARFVSDHLNEAKRLEWRQSRWPQILRRARQRKALLLFGDEASFAQWGSLSYTWAPRGQQPEVPTSGKRRAYKVFGLIDYFSGRLFYQGHTGRFNSASYAAFLLDVLSQTRRHVVVIQDGARYHTSQAMQQFFDAHADRLTIEQLPAYSPDFNPIEHLWKKVKKEATHLKYFPEFLDLQVEVERALLHFAQTPYEITVLMARYCESLGAMAA